MLKRKSKGYKNNYYYNWINSIEKPLLESYEGSNLKKSKSLVSIILVVKKDINKDTINTTVNSIINQISSDWELLIVQEDKSNRYKSYLNDRRIRIIQCINDLSYFERANKGNEYANGNLITFLAEGDMLSTYAISFITKNKDDNESLKIIYTDEDYLDTNNKRYCPNFKPDWNPDYLDNYNYFSKAVVYDRNLFNDLGGFNKKAESPENCFAQSAAKHLSEKQIKHIDRVLFHFKKQPKIPVGRVSYLVPIPQPLVSIIIPSRDQLQLLSNCLHGLLNVTSYKNIEIIIINNLSKRKETIDYLDDISNDTRVQVVKYEKPFNFSEMNNQAIKIAKGSIVCFLNNDISIIHDDWLAEMVSQACRNEIGCVGAKLYYPDGTIQHAGVILGLKGYASHAHKGYPGDDSGYCHRLEVAHNVSAVTAACLVMRKEVFNKVGGFDAVNLKVAYNDIDLCLKVREAGYRNLFTPHAQLVHHESKSRGKKRTWLKQIQLTKESNYFRKKWNDMLFNDPAYNKNLTLLREDFSLGFDRIPLNEKS